MSFEVNVDALVAFATNHVDASYKALEPWNEKRQGNFHISRERVGGCGEAVYKGGFVPPSFEFKPMTVADFERLQCLTLDPADDPGRSPNLWDWIMDYNLWDWGSNHGGSLKYENKWFEYYMAKELDGEGTVYAPPGDAPWAEKIETEWTTSLVNRLQEVEAIRAELDLLMEGLVNIAAEYMDTDLGNSIHLQDYPFNQDGDDL